MKMLQGSLRNRFAVFLIFLLVLADVAVGLAAPVEAPVSQEPLPAIHVVGQSFRPAAGESSALPPGLLVAANAQNQNGYYIVQFSGPILDGWRAAMEATGAQAVAYLPDFAYKVRMNPGQVKEVEKLANVIWVGPFQPGFKLSPDLKRESVNLFRIRVERGSDFGLTRAAIASTGAELITEDGNVLVVLANSDQLNAIAQVSDVAWVENYLLRERHNEIGGGVIMGANVANASHGNGYSYDGSTQIVAVADTGLGTGNATVDQAGIPASRIDTIFDWPTKSSKRCYTAYPDGPRDVDSGHGTHVSNSVLGGGDSSGVGRGTAPAAHLIFQAVEDFVDMTGQCALYYPDGYYLTGLPNDIRQLFQQANNAGARIHSNSWGSDAAGDYTADSANTDDFVWTHPDMVITFSAGNAGIDANADGVIDADSIGSPATAKNVITVGASENQRSSYPCDNVLNSGNDCTNTIFTYGAAWPADYPANPIFTDSSADNQEQMAAFSSRGPTDDGRIKPDVVAPGTWILSGYSDLFQQVYDAAPNAQNGTWQYDGWGLPYSSKYKYMGGTSMSNPLTAGGAAVVRDYYKKVHGIEASAALVKATLINSAVDMADEDNNPATNNIGIPNVHEGWGRVNLVGATDGRSFVENSAGIGTGNSASYSFTANGGPLKISLVWTDYPSTETANIDLVNDLDLTVTGPDGTFKGNVFSGGWSQTGGDWDTVNNVENVYLQSATVDSEWSVQIIGHNVPFGPQPFALVVSGGTPAGPSANTPPTANFSYNCTNLTCSFTNLSSDADGTVVGWTWDFGDNSSNSTEQNPPAHSYAAGTYTVNLVVTDNGGATGNASQSVTVTAPPTGGINLTATGYKDRGVQNAKLDWTGASGSVTIYRDNVQIASNISSTTYTDNIGQKGSGSYNYKVCLSNSPTTCSNSVSVVF